jgi:type I restriction enzyme, S subunit
MITTADRVEEHPALVPLEPDGIPRELKDRPQWVVSNVVRLPNGKLDKAPLQINGDFAKVDDPHTWTTFERAIAAVRNGKANALGYMFAADDPYCGVDEDSHRNAAKFDTYVISQSQMKLTVDSQKVDPRFIYYFFSSREGIQQIVNQNSSSGVPHINLTSLRKFSLPVPPLKEQQRIADILSAYDDLIENNQRRIALLEEAARMLYREWFVRFRFPGHEHVKIIDGVPELWKPHTLAHVCDAVGGGTPSTDKREYWDGGDIPWFTPTDVTRNACLALLDSEKRITESGLRGSSAKMLPAGTVLMTSRASVGFFGIVQVPSCTNQGFINIVPHKPNMRMYLLHNLMSRVEEIRSHAGGATYKEISKGKFKTLRVLVPDDSLLREFEELTTTFHAQVRTLHRASYKLAEARDLLLPRLMNGQIAV